MILREIRNFEILVNIPDRHIVHPPVLLWGIRHIEVKFDLDHAGIKPFVVVVCEFQVDGVFIALPILVEPRSRVFRTFRLKIVVADSLIPLNLGFEILIVFL